MEPVETIIVETTEVGCDGGTLGHPMVYLNLGTDGAADCPYCGQRFALAEGAKAGAGH